jgi:hypothetical protein
MNDVDVALTQLANSITANNADTRDKVIDIIFLYAGGAHNELNICNRLIADGFTIENIYLHDILYDDDATVNGIRAMFDANGLTSLYFSQRCNKIEDLSIDRSVAKRQRRRGNTICIACNPQIIGGVVEIVDINSFIQHYFTRHSFIYTIVLNRAFHLYTKDEHDVCIGANAGILYVDKHCFFEKIEALIAQHLNGPNGGAKTRRHRHSHTRHRPRHPKQKTLRKQKKRRYK